MTQSARDSIEADFVDALSELVECYTSVIPAITKTSPDEDRLTNAAVLGFGDAEFRGSAVLLASHDVAVSLSETTPLNPVDWLGELANQLVGRLKNKLCRYGMLPYMGTPVTVSGRDLDLGTVGTDPTAWRVVWSGGLLLAMLSLEIDDALVLEEDPESAPAEEGSLNLF